MSSPQAKPFAERSRPGSRADLARVAQGRYADLGMIIRLSWRVNKNQIHVDNIGGVDIDKIWTELGKLANSVRWELKFNDAELRIGDRGSLPSLRELFLHTAPLVEDLHQGATEERRRRSQRKHHDFAGILAQIDTATIASLCLEILQARRKLTPDHSPPALLLPIIGKPVFGSTHVLYPIEFNGTQSRQTVKWIIKIPAAGTPDTWDKLCAEALRTEALMLHMLRVETRVPVPEIIDADSSPHNELHVPYLIMEYVEGQTLDSVWFGDGGGDGGGKEIKERKIKALRSLAKAMLQLGRYKFERGGAPVFDDDGVLADVGPLRELDVAAMIDRWFGNEDCERSPLYAKVGPFRDTAEMYTALLDSHPCDDDAGVGVDRLLCLLIDLIREPAEPRPRGGKAKRKKKGFVLTHPDLSMRDIILSEEGDIKAILGWDSVRVVPRSRGNEALPRWLVRDLNPFIWRWRPTSKLWRKSSGEEAQGNRFEDTPWALRTLRDEYVRIVRRLKEEMGEREGEGGEGEGEGEGDVDVTKQSLLVLNLDAAVRDPRCRSAVLRKIIEKCSRPSEELGFDDIVKVLGEGGQIDGYKRKCLERNIKELIDRGIPDL
ncbi:hypothetical protein AAE478_008592 [Parahypoxylon ruwenzoriense]